MTALSQVEKDHLAGRVRKAAAGQREQGDRRDHREAVGIMQTWPVVVGGEAVRSEKILEIF